MRQTTTPLVALPAVVIALAATSAFQSAPTRGAILFEGARLLTGNPEQPIESSAFLVEDGRFARVGRKGEVQAPNGVTRVDLAGKTVMPALVDTHNHIGWTDHKTNVATTTSFTRALVIDHLQRYAYYGFAAANSMGIDRWNVDPDMPYKLRFEIIPNAARFLTVGRGIAATPMAGPPAEYRLGIPYGAQTEAEGRKHVQELKAKGVGLVKIWVDDRGGTVPKLERSVYEAIIDEAHRNRMRVVAHIFTLADAKQLLESGVDGFAHGVRNTDVDDEYVTMLKRYPKVWVGPNLPLRPLSIAETEAQIEWLTSSVPPSQIARMRAELAARRAKGEVAGGSALDRSASDPFSIQCRNLKRIRDVGMLIGLGTDGNADIGWGGHVEMADMVRCGMTPAEVVTAATRTSAEILELHDLGTVAAGKSADFIVLDANPLDDILHTRRITAVYSRGQPIDRATLSRAFVSEPN